MRLKSALPDIPQSVMDVLASDSCGVKSAEHFLFNTTPEDIFRRAAAGSVTYVDLYETRERMIAALAADGIRGDQWVQQGTSSSVENWGTQWTTGIAELDKILNSVDGGVIELSGGRGSCKTVCK